MFEANITIKGEDVLDIVSLLDLLRKDIKRYSMNGEYKKENHKNTYKYEIKEI